jgi:hypothetical protein
MVAVLVTPALFFVLFAAMRRTVTRPPKSAARSAKLAERTDPAAPRGNAPNDNVCTIPAVKIAKPVK